eukprot:2964423-Rhodomonas_salina.1
MPHLVVRQREVREVAQVDDGAREGLELVVVEQELGQEGQLADADEKLLQLVVLERERREPRHEGHLHR